jgi:hypothetical protein
MPHDRRSFFSSLTGFAAGGASAIAASPQRGTLENSLSATLNEIPLVNTHEHIIPEEERVGSYIDFFTLAGHYLMSDVISAGLSGDDLKVVRDEKAPLQRRWQAFAPHWENVRFTGYGQALRIAIRDIYEVEEISGDTVGLINNRILAMNKPGLYEDVLIRRSNIVYSVLDDYWNPAPVSPDPRFFVYARKFDRFVSPQSAADVRKLEELVDVAISDLRGLKRAMERSFEQSLEAGMVNVKSTLAYNREIHYAEIPESDAEEEIQHLLKDERHIPEGFRNQVERPYRRLEDHMFHHLIRLAEGHKIPVQIHTGLHAGNGNFIENSKPTHLTNLFFLYPQVKFDLFHISYPYQGELSVLAKIFPNVYVDFCWAHIISGSLSRRTLHEMLETVPANKIFGYGGDYRYPELSYAHAKLARQNIARVMAEKVDDGFFTETEAVRIARMILHDNPNRMFGWRRP